MTCEEFQRVTSGAAGPTEVTDEVFWQVSDHYRTCPQCRAAAVVSVLLDALAGKKMPTPEEVKAIRKNTAERARRRAERN